MHSSGMRTARLLTVSQHALPGGVPGWGVYLPGGGTCPGTPPVNRITDTCKNITLPQTSFAGGNKSHKHLDLEDKICVVKTLFQFITKF